MEESEQFDPIVLHTQASTLIELHQSTCVDMLPKHYARFIVNLYLIVKLHSICKVSVGFSLKRSAGDRLGPDFTTKDAAHDIIVLQRSVKPGVDREQRLD